MPASDILAVGATGWGLLMAVAPALQIRRMFETRSSHDVSLGYLSLLTPGFVLWLAYGLSIANAAIVITNTASLSFMLLTIAIAWFFRRGGPAAPGGGGGPAAGR
jgi:uncharacterized protein with PQ loop repeat